MLGVMAGLEACRTFTKTEPGCICLHGQRTLPHHRVLCAGIYDYNCGKKKKEDILAYQSLKPNFVQSVLTRCVNHAIYFTPKLYSGMHPLLQLEFSTHTHFIVKFCLFLYRTCVQSGTHYFSETHTAYALFSCFREIMQSALHAYVSVLWGNDSGYE